MEGRRLGRSHPDVVRVYFWLAVEGSLQAVFGESDVTSGTEPRSSVCKTNFTHSPKRSLKETDYAVGSLEHLISYFVIFKIPL